MAPTAFPSPAEHLDVQRLDIANLLQAHKPDTFYMRVQGHAGRAHGVHSGDIVVVRRSLPARPGRLVVACVQGELTLQCLPSQPLSQLSDHAVEVWGVVTATVRLLEA